MKSLPADKDEKFGAAETARRFRASLLGAFKDAPKAKASLTKTATQKLRSKKKPKV